MELPPGNHFKYYSIAHMEVSNIYNWYVYNKLVYKTVKKGYTLINDLNGDEVI